MAKQAGPFYITGCIENICFYHLMGDYYARMKSSLDAKRIKNDPAFSETRRYAELLGRASKIASAVYNELPKEKRKHRLYRKLTGRAMKLLKGGKTEVEVLKNLHCTMESE